MTRLAPSTGVVVRRATPADESAILDLTRTALGWTDDGPHGDLFRWKHGESPFGPSPMWVALEGDAMVGFRSFLRWELVRPDGSIVRVARAVDTATHPSWRGRGIFSRLTLHGLDELRTDGVGFIFNTPNDQSRPGYLKMGWRQLARVGVAVRPTSVWSLACLARARTAATKWSEPTTVGDPAADVLADTSAVEELLGRLPRRSLLTTHRHPRYLAWRYGFGPLHYRILCAGATISDGVCVFRLRRRGPALEVAVVDMLAIDARCRAALFDRLARAGAGDYLISTSRTTLPGHQGLRLPRQGPILTWRAVVDPDPPALPSWDLQLGDVELF